MGVASRVPTYPTIPHMLGLPFRGIGPLQDRVARIGETEAGELRHLREQAACQPRGHEQRAALRTERVLALGQRRFQGYITTWARHGSGSPGYKFGAAARHLGPPGARASGAAAALQLVGILPRLFAARVRRARKKPFPENELARAAFGARSLQPARTASAARGSLHRRLGGRSIRTQGAIAMPSSPAAARPPVVLIGDAQEWFARALETVLVQGGYGVVKAYTASTLLQQLERAAPDAIILAVDLPGATGLGLCRQLRAESRVTAGTPIVLTQPAPATRRETLNALRAGASELWVGQQLDSEELLLRLAAGLRAKADADRAWASGLVDPTTELYNSRGLARRVLEIGAAARRRARPTATAAFTIPQNGAPDVVLVTRVLREAARASDAVGRIGPREFIVLVPEAGPDAALRLAERLADAFIGK